MVEVETDHVEVEQQADDSKQRVCPECGAAFSPRYGRQVCCSDACKRSRVLKMKKSFYEQRRGPRTPRNCVICGKEFLARSPSRKTCSHECAVEHYLRSSHQGGGMPGGDDATRWVERCARAARQKREQARRIRFARLDALAPKPKIEIITRNGIIIERRGTVPAGCHAADFIRHNA